MRWDDGSGRITVVRSKTDVEAAGARSSPSPPPPWPRYPPSSRRGLVAE